MNTDETPLFINILSKKKIDKIESKVVNINNANKKLTLLWYSELLLMTQNYHECLCLKLNQEEELKKSSKALYDQRMKDI